ncbi:MAG: nickel-dependent hydrogenase large subunit [Nitrososphaerales archaeon]
MHESLDINIEQISKTEGHADLEVKVRNGNVEDVKLKISENKRFYTQAVRKRNFQSVPHFVSRICGTCSIAHMTCATEAVEKCLEIVPSAQTELLRKLAVYGMMIRDHAMHLYFFCLPDIFRTDSVFEFDESKKHLIEQAFSVKGAGNNLSKAIAGRAVHATYERIGHFSHIPTQEEVRTLIHELKNARNHVLDLIQIFYDSDFRFERITNFVALVTKDFSFLEGMIHDSGGTKMEEEDYWSYLKRVVIPYSQATGFTYKGEEYMVGALARMNLNKGSLHKDTRNDIAKFLEIFPSFNIYHNNLAQAIEILHCIDHSIQILEGNEFKEESIPQYKLREGHGVGVIEAPRGTLYHMIELDKEGRVKFANFVIPTAQNQIKMENDIRVLIPQILDKSRHDIEHELEKVIRAYDPCMSCASHFLRVRWK